LLIKIISATPGPNTTERILELIQAYPEGIGTKELSDRLNRPVSMVNLCLKSLISAKQVYVRLSENGMQQIYYPTSIRLVRSSA
jgi:predicted transcriptional regulator